MAIYERSRYENEATYLRSFRGKLRNTLTFRTIDRTVSNRARPHVVTSVDEIDNMAYEEYGDEDLFWVILDANPGLDPFKLPVGETIFIPPADEILNRVKT